MAPPVDLTQIEVLPADRVFTPPQVEMPGVANFGNKIQLVGGSLSPMPVSRHRVLDVVLYWQALAEMDVPYTVFVHLLGPEGWILAGQDDEPVEGTRPTTGWVPGEYVTDPHELLIPADLEPAEYTVAVGLYDAAIPGLPRLPILQNGSETGEDRVIIAIINLE